MSGEVEPGAAPFLRELARLNEGEKAQLKNEVERRDRLISDLLWAMRHDQTWQPTEIRAEAVAIVQVAEEHEAQWHLARQRRVIDLREQQSRREA